MKGGARTYAYNIYCPRPRFFCQGHMSAEKKSFSLAEDEWQTILDSLSNTIFNEEITEEARKRAKELFVKLQKDLPRK